MKKHFRISTILAVLVFSFSIFFIDISKTEAVCVINSAKLTPNGEQPTGWWTSSVKPKVRIDVVTTGCAGQTLRVILVESLQPIPLFQTSTTTGSNDYLIPASGKLTILTKAGTTGCGLDSEGQPSFDCKYHIRVVDLNSLTIFYPLYDSHNDPNGTLSYDCDGICWNGSNPWVRGDFGDTETIVTGSDDVTNTQLGNDTYKFLAPLPGLTEVKGNEGVAIFFEKIFIIMISLAGVLAVLSLILAGFQYITTGVFSVKTDAKDRIWNSILGLLLALGAFVILNTINPDLVNNLGLNIDSVTLTTPGDTNEPLVSNFQPLAGMTCPGNGGKAQIPTIANSFVNKVTYKMGGKGSGNGNTIFFDCSGFVSQVIKCAGGTDQGGTVDIFSGNGVEAVTSITNTSVNGIALQPGDLLGWKAGNGEQFGHVVIYVGNGKVMDSHGPENKTNQAIGTLDSTYYKKNGVSRIKYIRRTTLN
jgi:hypothetical protein